MTASFDDLDDSSYIRASQLVPSPAHPERPALLQFSIATLWRKVKAGTFPAPVKLSSNITAWKVGDIKSWLLSLSPIGPSATVA